MALKYFQEASGKGIDKGDIVGYWNLAQSDTANPLIVPRYSDKSVQISGTWGGATVTLQQANYADTLTYSTAYDPFNASITGTADTIVFTILANSYAIKPVITGGDGTTNLYVSVTGRGTK